MKDFDPIGIGVLERDQQKAESFTLGNPRFHRGLKTRENTFDASYQEHQYKDAVARLEASGKVEKIVVEEAGCEPLVLYRMGEPHFVVTTHIHGDEPGPAIPMFLEMTKRIREGDKDIADVLIISRCNAEAYRQLRRGVSFNEDLLTRMMAAQVISEDDRQHIVASGVIDQETFAQLLKNKGYHVSTDDDDRPYIDLNRQYIEREKSKEPDLSLLFPKARQLLKAIRTYAPDAKEGFSFHADNAEKTVQIDPQTGQEVEVQNGCYLYDTPPVYPDSPDADQDTEQFVKTCITNFQEQMRTRGIPLLNGIDDINDKILGANEFKDGYASVPANEKKIDGELVRRTSSMHDQTLETALVRWGMNRYWCFETAGWINIDRRAEMIGVILDTLVLPTMKRYQQQKKPTM